LLLSCGKDNRILCWNPNTESRAGEVSLPLMLGFFSLKILVGALSVLMLLVEWQEGHPVFKN